MRPRQRSRASANDGPGDARLRADAVEMGADRARPVRIGRAQRELHPRGDVAGAPSRRVGRRAPSGARPRNRRSDWARGARCGPCRDGCARRRTSAARCGRRAAAAAPRRSRARRPARSSAMRPSSIRMSTRAKPSRVAPCGRMRARARARPRATQRRALAMRKAAFTSRGSARCRASDAAAGRRTRSARGRSGCRSIEISSSAANMRGMLRR